MGFNGPTPTQRQFELPKELTIDTLHLMPLIILIFFLNPRNISIEHVRFWGLLLIHSSVDKGSVFSRNRSKRGKNRIDAYHGAGRHPSHWPPHGEALPDNVVSHGVMVLVLQPGALQHEGACAHNDICQHPERLLVGVAIRGEHRQHRQSFLPAEDIISRFLASHYDSASFGLRLGLPHQEVCWVFSKSVTAQQLGSGMNGLGLGAFTLEGGLGLEADGFTLGTLLNACGNLWWLKMGKEVHGNVFTLGMWGNMVVESSFLDMYRKCSDVGCASAVFGGVAYKVLGKW
ncbi:hypothetical protein Fmac_018657 [Flemingia macrophylla]|uniref:Uncharacterized protein n=1 Tax=Flemingia macrophylla TaxID=520843 RepID=A0ABD1M5M9_9FABA